MNLRRRASFLPGLACCIPGNMIHLIVYFFLQLCQGADSMDGLPSVNFRKLTKSFINNNVTTAFESIS